ncbi:MAG: N-formylglutamate amidohydrolase [Deltaproteobacteria bacterium]|jgi:N-formylglutamate deformylase|nr:N-formylglutamate amidohydrolase [Deltaproteobacteria bacterium]
MSEGAGGEAFALIRPSARALPLLVEVPHAGLEVPGEARALLTVDDRVLLRDADTWVDGLFRDVVAQGATLLTASCSRYVVDLNRDESDHDPASVASSTHPQGTAPRGVIWRESSDGTPALRRPLTDAEFDQRIERYHRPYHRALSRELEALRARHGVAVLLCGHSMPATGRSQLAQSPRRRADVVPGTRGRSTAGGKLIDAVDAHFRAAGLSVRHDDPYRGGATTQRYGRPSAGMHAIQVELNRDLYMDERTLSPKPEAMAWLRSLCTALVPKLADALS